MAHQITRLIAVIDSDANGSALDLTIIKELASQCGGTAQMQAPEPGDRGLLLGIHLFPK